MLPNVVYIFAEVGFHINDRECQYFPPFHDAMQRNDFNLCGLYDAFRWSKKRRLLGFCNALYLKNNVYPIG